MWILWYLFGILLTILSWYLVLRLILSGTKKNFYAIEYGVYSFLIWVVLIPFLLFIAWRIGLPLSLIWMLILVLWIIFILLFLNIILKTKIDFIDFDVKDEFISFPSWIKVWLFLFLIWLLAKLAFGFLSIVNVPTYQDDTFANWNIRTKIFYERESLVLDSTDKDYLWQWYKQYPLTPSLYRTYLMKFNWAWNEWLVNLPSLLFYVCALFLVFFSLLKETKKLKRAILWLVVLSSIPLYYIHWTNPYFDVFQSVYFFSALYILYIFVRDRLPIMLPILFIGMLWYTKSEWMIIFTTAVLSTYAARYLIKNKFIVSKDFLRLLFIIIWWVLIINLPFLVFKLSNWLWFWNGNANLAETALSLHTEIFPALYRALFLWWSYNLLFFAFIVFIVYDLLKKRIDKNITLWFMFWFLISFAIIIFVYLTTFTYQYVLDQTGINRSLMQIIPVLVFLLVLLIRDCYEKQIQ